MNRLYWITGLAGAGKSTIARALVKSLRQEGAPAILLDGDELREAFGMTSQHDSASRRELARTYARLGKLIHSQGMTVVCATISPFPEVRNWLRSNVHGYVEVYVRVLQTTLQSRDQKGLYSRASKGDCPNLVGEDIPFAEPTNPDIIIGNEPGTLIEEHVTNILNVNSIPLRRIS